MSERYIQKQEIEGYSSVVVYGWAPMPSFEKVMQKAMQSPSLRDAIARNNPLLRHLMAK